MIERYMPLKNRKKERIKINNLNDFKDSVKRDGYNINGFDEENFKEEITRIFDIDKNVSEMLYTCVNDDEITYRAYDAKDFIDYIEKMILFEAEYNKLFEKISKMNKLKIDRIEYEREPSYQDIDEDIINSIEEVKSYVDRMESKEEIMKLEFLEKELDENYLYAKDIELLKKMLIVRKEEVIEKYDIKTKTKTISIEIPDEINYEYIKAKKGSVEYHEFLSNNIPRMQRLIKNLNKYMIPLEKEKTTFKIDQSKALQDSINIAVAVYDNREFRAISGSNNIINYTMAPLEEEAFFESCKVNKLGKLGVGYNRVNDSEKKILEEIHKQIETKMLKNKGTLILYSKWEPCPSCYYVISQFCKKYPNIKVQVKYNKEYGE